MNGQWVPAARAWPANTISGLTCSMGSGSGAMTRAFTLPVPITVVPGDVLVVDLSTGGVTVERARMVPSLNEVEAAVDELKSIAAALSSGGAA